MERKGRSNGIMKTLESDRLILRSWNIKDLEDLHEFASNKKVADLAGFKARNNKDESLKLLQRFIIDSNDSLWAIELKEENKVIGWIELHEPIDKTFVNSKEIGTTLSEEYWGQGLILEAIDKVINYVFNEEENSIVVCSHFISNTQSEKAIKKCGFRFYLEADNKRHYFIKQ